MNKRELIAVMRSVLEDKMALPHMADFSEDARLNEQLCLDSVRVLELLVHLELEFGLALPEQALMQKPPGTVGGLAELLLQQAARPSEAGSAA